ncbi:MAG: transglycosylase domain-containing protein [Actinomycetota bacterium]
MARGKKPGPRKGRARKRSKRRLILYGLGVPLLLFTIAVVGTYLFARVPEPRDIAVVQSARVLDTQGRFVGRLSAEADRVSIDLKDMPDALKDAVVAVEDHRFFQHRGISPVAIARAAVMTALGKSRQGGSTITQQFVKNAYVGNQRTIWRKVREAILAVKLERQRSKEQILEDYLNTIYLGRGAYGVQAASKAYFGKSASRLRIDEAALLAGIIRSPETYEPTREPELAKGRRDTALSLMVERGYLDADKAERLKARAIKVRPRRIGGLAPHFLEEVRDEVETLVGANALYAGEVTVQVSLDLDAQRAAEDAIASVYDSTKDPQAALVAVDPETGAIRAMVGSRDYATLQLNLARTRRQPGSTFKVVVLTEAIRDGISPDTVMDAPASKTFQLKSGPWKVRTYDDRDRGRISIARATELSVNTTYAQLILDVGPEDVAELASDMGVRREIPAFASLALGTVEVSPLEMASVNATIAARGVWREPYFIERVTDKDGKVLFRHDLVERRVLDKEVADQVAWVLKGVIDNGTGVRARLGREAAGKTGTTQDSRDAWFTGFTPDLAAVVWNGFADGDRLLKNIRGRDVTGGSFPAEMWRRFMKGALDGVPASRFVRPGQMEPESSPSSSPSASPSPTASVVATATRPPSPTATATQTSTGTSTPTPVPTRTPTPTSTPTSTPTPTKTDAPRPDPSGT